MKPSELLDYLLLHHESEFVEFKGSNSSPENIGELVSALANGAVLQKKDEAYLVYGVNDDRKVVGTSFEPSTTKIGGGQPFKNWLATGLDHCEPLKYIEVDHLQGHVLIIVIPRARTYPVKFKSNEYVRVGDSKKQLSEHPELARKLWEQILRISFEDGNASDLLDESEIFELLDFTPYYVRRNIEVPTLKETILGHMVNEAVVSPKLGKYFITNLGAILFATDMSKFDSLLNRGVRVIKYKGNDKSAVERSQDGQMGYALSIDNLVNFLMILLPSEEFLEGGTRKSRQTYSREMVKELATNMVIHQDFSVPGYAPRVEIYNDRVEFTNPGAPVIEVARFLDSNNSRNPRLAKLMRFMKLCEERGMGIDIVEAECEKMYLPSPAITTSEDFTRVIVFDHKTLRQFNSYERINLVYMHCCLQSIKHSPTTNETLRSRFAEGVLSSTVASRWISETLEKGMIKPFDPTSISRKQARYLPSWA
jgi:ATP-dependent DNA helicase RecG